MDRYFAYARVLATGGPLGGATITVYNAGMFNLAWIYDDDGPNATPKANPFIADANGFFFFYTLQSKYDIQISGGSVGHAPYTWGDVAIAPGHKPKHVLATSSALGSDHTVSGLTPGHVLTAVTATKAKFAVLPGAYTEHAEMDGLDADDHPQYVLLAGRPGQSPGGQDLFGGTGPGDTITLRGSSDPSGGNVLINPDGGDVGVGLSVPSRKLSVAGHIESTIGGFVFPDGTIQITANGVGGSGLWAISGVYADAIYNVNIGRVGIGTDEPTKKLTVRGSEDILLRLERAEFASPCSIEFVNGDGIIGYIRANSSPGGIKFGYGNLRGLFVAASGRAGFGTDSPQAALHVVGNALTGGASGVQIRLESEVGYSAGIDFYQTSAHIAWITANSQRIGMFQRDGAGVSTDIGTGRVGVGLGEETPAARLHVRGTATDGVVIRAEAVGSPTIDLYDENVRRALLVADDVAIRLSNGLDEGAVKIAQSTGFVVVGPPSGVVTPTGQTIGVDPSRRLSVVGRSGEDFQLSLESPTAGGLEMRTPAGVVGGLRASDTTVELSTANGVVVTIQQSDDFVGIGTASPGYELDVAGDVHATSFPTSSDERLKEVASGIDGALDRVCRLEGIRFTWNQRYSRIGRIPKSRNGSIEIGIIAQELAKEFPELVSKWRGDDGVEYYAVEYGRFSAVLLEAVKELRGELCRLKKRLN